MIDSQLSPPGAGVLGRFLTVLLSLGPCLCASAAGPDDLSVRVSRMQIDHAQVGETEVDIDFIRTLVELELGFGAFSTGLVYQDARSGDPSGLPDSQEGMMWTASHAHFFQPRWHLVSRLRVGLDSNDDPSQPLYATDTDLAVRLIRSSPEGAFYWNGRPAHPSAYLGGVVSQYGRVQAIGGMGLWWNGLSSYVTGFYAFNGVEDPMNAGDDADIAFAHLKNEGVTLSAGYEWLGWRLDVQKNFGIKNSGDDITLGFGYRHLFGSGEWLP